MHINIHFDTPSFFAYIIFHERLNPFKVDFTYEHPRTSNLS